MQTTFTPDQLKDPDIERSNAILRSCVHCGFCTATCPTYQVLGDELDSPRGRIYQIKDMLENERVPDKRTVLHVDRCLSCLACMTTCPSGVHYMHLVDHARAYIEKTTKRPFGDRALRWMLARILPYPTRFRLALLGAKVGRPFARLMPDARLRAMLEMAPKTIPPVSRNDDPQSFAPAGTRRMRVALMTGCAQRALNTDINDATIRILRRFGCEVVVARGAGCCGALTHHMGKSDESHATAAEEHPRLGGGDGWRGAGRDRHQHLGLRHHGQGLRPHVPQRPARPGTRRRVSEIAMDISEILTRLELPKGAPRRTWSWPITPPVRCSTGSRSKTYPKTLLKQAGFTVVEPADSHLCCGSAGTYNLMQPEISKQLKERKLRTLKAKSPDIIAAGNIGCMMQLGADAGIPVVHTVELLDWATGGPKPPALSRDPAEDAVPILR